MGSSSPSAVVSGASGGIGLACAEALAGAGFRVVLLGRNRSRLDAAAEKVRGSIAVRCDVSNRDAVAGAAGEIVKQLEGAPSVLVNNAGHFHLATLDRETTEGFSQTVEVNLVGVFHLVHAFLPHMRNAGAGHVITIGSIADHAAFPENAAYAASKYGVRGLHEVLREETRGSGIRASLISPGPVNTPLWDEIDPDSRTGFTPRAKMLPASAVASAVVWVATLPAEANVDELRLSRS